MGFISVFVAIFLIYLTKVFNPLKDIENELKSLKTELERIPEKLHHPFKDVEYELKSLKTELERIPEKLRHPSRSLFVEALSKESDFWGKLTIQRADKYKISRFIIDTYIQDGETVILDSGTSIYEIPRMLHKRNIKIYTNNLLASISIVPLAEKSNCFQLPGNVDTIYGATYDIDNIEAIFKPIEANEIILAATAISFEDGPGINYGDDYNLAFKKELIMKAIYGSDKPRLIIAVDWTKFKEEFKKKKVHRNVVKKDDWLSVLKRDNFALVTTYPDKLLKTQDAKIARQEIQKFKRNENEGGMKINIVEI